MRTVLASLTHRADALIEEGKFKRVQHIHIVWGTILYSLMYFVPIFLAIYFGTDLVKSIVDAIPEWITDGLNLASKLLPAYGFALLLQTMLSKKMMPFFGFGLLDYCLFRLRNYWRCSICRDCGLCHVSN